MNLADQETALQALDLVGDLDAEELDARIDAEIGDNVLGVLSALAKASMPGIDSANHSRTVHLMVLSYLMRGEIERVMAPTPKKTKAKAKKR